MKEIQEALKDIGIPVLAGVWRATSPDQNPPEQYVVYSSTTTESSHADDLVTSYRTFVYLNLWSKFDPTAMRDKIRKAMYAYGFTIREESDKGYNQPAYDTFTHQYTIQWTWVWYEEVPLPSVPENTEQDEDSGEDVPSDDGVNGSADVEDGDPNADEG